MTCDPFIQFDILFHILDSMWKILMEKFSYK